MIWTIFRQMSEFNSQFPEFLICSGMNSEAAKKDLFWSKRMATWYGATTFNIDPHYFDPSPIILLIGISLNKNNEVKPTKEIPRETKSPHKKRFRKSLPFMDEIFFASSSPSFLMMMHLVLVHKFLVLLAKVGFLLVKSIFGPVVAYIRTPWLIKIARRTLKDGLMEKAFFYVKEWSLLS